MLTFKDYLIFIQDVKDSIGLQFRNYILLLSFITLIGSLQAQKRNYILPKNIDQSQYDPQTIIVKFRTDPKTNMKGRVYGRTTIAKSYKAIPSAKSSHGKHPLATIYKIDIDKDRSVESAINDLLQDENVIYAEPYFNHHPLFIPNDPAANPTGGAQDYLAVINAYDAWTIERGDSTIVIGVLDSGVQPDHPDLQDQIALNLDDPINGIDDDNDGLVDNYIGWDIADNDNNPTADTDAHGTEVTATSSARANNGQGMAGTGYNSKFMPIKTFRSGTDAFNMGYEAIALAADLGCKVINLSWGSPNSFSQFGQDVINYAVQEKDVVVVAAAGNTNERLDFYPASFDNVLSVGASNIFDEKASFATYSYNIDMLAPGDDIYSATNNSTYVNGRIGTSYSAPMVAGAAALVRARFPNLTAKQVVERLRATADDIYDVGGNSAFEGQLGRGRLNMFRALTDDTPALRIDSLSYSNGIGEFAYFGDTLAISLILKNYLSVISGVTISVSSNSEFVDIINNQFEIPFLNTLETADNFNFPFQVVLAENAPADEEIIFRLDYTGAVYQDFEYFSITTSGSFTTINGNDLSMTVSSDGDIAYDESYFQNGIGVTFENKPIADNIGLIVAFDQDNVADNAPTSLTSGQRDEDFIITEPLKRYSNSSSPVDIRSVFSVADSIRIEQTYLANNIHNFIIQQYRIINTGNETFSDFALALYADWDIEDKDLNEANWLVDEKMGYVNNGTTYVGLALLSSQDSIYSAINNRNFNGNTADIPTALNDSVKFSHVSQGILKTQAGENNGGNDVSHMVGAHIPSLEVNDAAKVVFVSVAGHSLAELIDNLNAARLHLQNYQNNPPIISISETCLGETAIIDPASGTNFNFYSDAQLTNLLFSGDAFVTDALTSSKSYYVTNQDESYSSDVYQVIAKPKLVNAAFTVNPDPLLLDETGNTAATFTDTSTDAVSWNWNFDNGFTAAIENPIMNFGQTGIYEISLSVVNDIGCEETVTQELIVANRSNLPDIDNQFLCKGEEVTLSASNATNLEFYADEDLSNLISTGSAYTSIFIEDTVLYAISTDSLFASNPKEVIIDIDNVEASFVYTPDTTDIRSNSLINLLSTSKDNAITIWFNDGELISTKEKFNFDYEGLSQLNLLLVAESLSSCTDSLRVTIPFSESPSIESQSIKICEGENITISPGGEYLHFYNDSALTELAAKGSNLTFESILNDTIFYVTNNETFLESNPATYTIEVSDIEAGFDINSDPLNLAEASGLSIIDQSTGASSWLWLVGSDTISFEQNPSIDFMDIGVFTVAQWVTDIIGCSDSASRTLEVVNITSLEKEGDLLIYPNPVKDILNIQSIEFIRVKLYNQTGMLMINQSGIDPAISVKDLSDGIYFLEIDNGTEWNRYKIIKSD